MSLGFADVDPRVRSLLAQQGIERLYPPQEAALDAALSGRNLVLSIPTASGKSLVAYLAILHRYLRNEGKALYIVPLRALASEKYEELKAFRPLGLRVGIATGDLDDEDQRLSHYDVVVATSEKADSLLRHRAGWLNDVKTLVADEIHLLTDAGRGPTLEVLLSRFRAMGAGIQILGLSATIKNARQLAKWLEADVVESDWRPTKLKRGVAYGRAIDFLEDGSRELKPDTGDAVSDLVVDILEEGGQALVFLSTRKSAEALAGRLGRVIRSRLTAADQTRLLALAKAVSDDEAAAEAVEAVPAVPTDGDAEAPPPAFRHGLGGRLAQALVHGAAFHNAGLSSRQRRLVEQNFRGGLIKVLCATPTLAAGVNTPARRVIIRDIYRYDANLGSQPLPVLEVQQMMGRAGRPRFDPYGEAVLVAKTHDDRETLIQSYIKADPEPVTSKLGSEPALRVHILASVASGFARDTLGLERFLDSTFYAHQGEAWLIKAQLQQVLRFLEENDFLHRQGVRLEATPFGKRTSDLYIDPLSALILRTAIERAAKKKEELHDFALLHAIASTPEIDSLFLRTKDDWVMRKLAEVDGVDGSNLKTLNECAEFVASQTGGIVLTESSFELKKSISEELQSMLQRGFSRSSGSLGPGENLTETAPPGPDEDLAEWLTMKGSSPADFFDRVCDSYQIPQLRDKLLFESHEARSQEEFLSRVKTASLLHDWIEEVPVDTLEERYAIGPGDVRNKVDRAEWLAHAARELARLLHFETATALNHLPLRLRHGARKELLPLIELEGIGRVRARTLHRGGFTTLGAIRKGRVEDLASLPGFGQMLAQSLKRQVGADAEPKEVGLGKFGT